MHLRKVFILSGLLLTLWLLVLTWQIYSYSSTSSSRSADAAIVLGAAVWDGQPSPVFEERIKHGIGLYQSGDVEYLIFTGGIGEGDTIAESEVARDYAVNNGVPTEKILIETTSRVTYDNLYEACQLMEAVNLQKVLIVSDPLHMKRSLRIAKDLGLDAYPSPTLTSRYQTWRSKSGLLAYELFFYILHMGRNVTGRVDKCPV